MIRFSSLVVCMHLSAAGKQGARHVALCALAAVVSLVANIADAGAAGREAGA